MGKSFKGFSKALSLILAVAMVVTCVPTSAYAAELLADESEDILISNDAVAEESSDALVTDDASASEEKSSSLIDTQTEADLAAAPEENTAGEEDVLPDADAVPRALGITDPTNSTNLDDSTASTAALTGLTYGTEFDPIEFKSRATIGATTADYSKVTWSVLKYVDPDLTGDALLADENLTDATADLTALGLKWSTSGEGNTGLTLSISGDPAPKKYLASQNLVLRTVGTENTENRKVLPVVLTINAATITGSGTSLDWTASNTVTYEMGYDVFDTTPNPVPETPYVVAKKITLSTTTMAAYKITDLTYELSGDDASAFEVVAPTAAADKELYSGHPVTIIVKPVVGLSSKGDKNGDGVYTATLKVKSASIAPAGVAIGSPKIKIVSNLKFSGATQQGGKAVTKSGLEADPVDLGKIKVGETFNQMVVTAAGGNGKITITKGGGAFPKNITGAGSNTANTATYTISGQSYSGSDKKTFLPVPRPPRYRRPSRRSAPDRAGTHWRSGSAVNSPLSNRRSSYPDLHQTQYHER